MRVLKSALAGATTMFLLGCVSPGTRLTDLSADVDWLVSASGTYGGGWSGVTVVHEHCLCEEWLRFHEFRLEMDGIGEYLNPVNWFYSHKWFLYVVTRSWRCAPDASRLDASRSEPCPDVEAEVVRVWSRTRIEGKVNGLHAHRIFQTKSPVDPHSEQLSAFLREFAASTP